MRSSQRIEGKNTIYIILFLPMCIPNREEAVDTVIEKVPEEIKSIDTALYNMSDYFPIIFGMN